MKSEKDIQTHIDQLMKDAEKPAFLSTSDDFEETLKKITKLTVESLNQSSYSEK